MRPQNLVYECTFQRRDILHTDSNYSLNPYLIAGVNVEKGESFVNYIKSRNKRFIKKDSRIIDGIGGFAALYKMEDNKVIASSCDGVGTKLKLAIQAKIYDTIGIDLVAMNTNDLICTGCTPLFFLDYLAVGMLNELIVQKIIDGVIKGCELAGITLIGGETAEMPGIYSNNDFDLAGFSVGEGKISELLTDSSLKEGMEIIGIKSSGFHSNGYSLIRKLIDPSNLELLNKVLTPTIIYSKKLSEIMRGNKDLIKGLAHITGGGFKNISRISKKFDYQIENVPTFEEIPSVFHEVLHGSDIAKIDLYKTFNMGVGMVCISENYCQVKKMLKNCGLECYRLGYIKRGEGRVYLKSLEI